LDPSIFEIKYPDNDIIGKVRAFGWYIRYMLKRMQPFMREQRQKILVLIHY
jgi:hypothetical protein